MTRAAEEALSDRSQVWIDFANVKMKNSLYRFVDVCLPRWLRKKALDEVFERSIRRWTPSSTFMDTFAKCALTSSRLVCPVAKFLRKNMCNQEEERKTETKIVNIPYPALKSPPVSSCSLRSSSEGNKRNKASHRRHKKIAASKEEGPQKGCRKHKKSKSSSSSSMSLHTLPSSSERDSLLSTSEIKALKARLAESKLRVLQTMKKPFALAVYNWTNRLSNRLARYDNTLMYYVAKLVKKVKSQMKTHFFDPKYHISIVGFLATFKVACNTIKIREETTM